MAKETIQESYINGLNKIKALKEQLKKSPADGQASHDLQTSITKLEIQLSYLQGYLRRVEQDENFMVENLKGAVEREGEAVIIYRFLSNYEFLYSHLGDTDEVKKIRNSIRKQINYLNPKFSGNDVNSFEKELMTIINKGNDSAKKIEEMSILRNNLNRKILGNDFFVDVTHSDVDERIEKHEKNEPKTKKTLEDEGHTLEENLEKKWLLKSKIDKLNNEIEELKKLLETDISPEKRAEIEKKLSDLSAELNILQKEYGEVLISVRNLIEKNINEETKAPPESKSKSSSNSDSRVTSSAAVPQNTNLSNQNTKLLAVPQKSWFQKFKNKFVTEHKDEEYTKVEPTVLKKTKIEPDETIQKLLLISQDWLPKVLGGKFYHIVRSEDELQYVCEPLSNIKCTRKDLVEKIKEVQEKYGEYYKSLHEVKEGNPLYANPDLIATKLIGISFGFEKRERILRTICALESSINSKDAINVLKGKGKLLFIPLFNQKGEYSEEEVAPYYDESSNDLDRYAGLIQYQLDETNRIKDRSVRQYFKNNLSIGKIDSEKSWLKDEPKGEQKNESKDELKNEHINDLPTKENDLEFDVQKFDSSRLIDDKSQLETVCDEKNLEEKQIELDEADELEAKIKTFLESKRN